jgi:hypothetical protein
MVRNGKVCELYIRRNEKARNLKYEYSGIPEREKNDRFLIILTDAELVCFQGF